MTAPAFPSVPDRDRQHAVNALASILMGRAVRHIYYFCHEGKPIPKGRPRTGKGRRVYTPARTVRAERDLGFCFRAAQVGDPLDGKVALAAIFYGGRGDSDNLLKLVMDAGTLAGAWGDDRQVIASAAFVERPADVPRSLIAWAEFAGPSLPTPTPVRAVRP